MYKDRCPIVTESILSWFSFSEEGMLIVGNNFGTISGLNYKNKKWTPILDLKHKYPKDYRSLWIIGITDGDLIGIMMPRGLE